MKPIPLNQAGRRFARRARTILLALACCIVQVSAAEEGPPGKALEVAERSMSFSGGIWSKLAFIKFEFVYQKDGKELLSRTHWWDVKGSRHRLEMKGKDGADITCLTYLPTKEGVCTVAGEALIGEAAREHVDRSYAIWINDTYWLLMPYKLKDPGVHLSYAGEHEEAGRKYDKVHLSFDEGTGLTSNDQYWGYFDRSTGKMIRWEYLLQNEAGEPGAGDTTTWNWTGWKNFDGVMLATERVSPGGSSKVLFRNVQVFGKLPDFVFSQTAPVDPSRIPSSPSR